MQSFKFGQGEKVTVDWHPVRGSGIVVGCATIPAAVIGRHYIVKLDDPRASGIDPAEYPFECVSIPEIAIKKEGE